MKFPSMETIAMFLLIIGGLNAGVNAVFEYNAIGQILGTSSVSTAFYALMGLSALWVLADRFDLMPGSDNA